MSNINIWEKMLQEEWYKWRDVRPSMVTHTRNLCSAFNPSKVHTHSSEHTHTVDTHPEQWAAIFVAAPGEQLGVRCLAQGHLSRGIEGGESAEHSLPPPTIPAGPRQDSNSQPLDYESNSLTSRPRLPLKWCNGCHVDTGTILHGWIILVHRYIKPL